MYGHKHYKANESFATNFTLQAKLSFEINGKDNESVNLAILDRPFECWFWVVDSIMKDNNIPYSVTKFEIQPQSGRIVNILVNEVLKIEPDITNCATPNCPYNNYFRVCRNCEDVLHPDPALYDAFQIALDEQKQTLEALNGKVLCKKIRSKIYQKEWEDPETEEEELIDIFLAPP